MFCFLFAFVYIAKGNMVVHCGGPGSLSSCIDQMGGIDFLGQDNVDNYNRISIDQVIHDLAGRWSSTFLILSSFI